MPVIISTPLITTPIAPPSGFGGDHIFTANVTDNNVSASFRNEPFGISKGFTANVTDNNVSASFRNEPFGISKGFTVNVSRN